MMQNYVEPWLDYQTPIVRQLAFVIASPNLLLNLPSDLNVQYTFEFHDDHFWLKQYENYKRRLQQLDQNPAELIHFMDQLKSTRLGLRFEYLFWFWLQDPQQQHYQLIGHSIQIIEAKHTLGELDFVILNLQTQQVEHWEVALKFYLAEADFSLKNWYGLNRSDTLFRKLNHFGQRQFKFSEVKNLKIEKRFAILKGQLYFPEQADLKNIPNWVNPNRRLGYWGNHIYPQNYYRLQRHEWICPMLQQSSGLAVWWTNGLYRNYQNQHDYMFRQDMMIKQTVKKL